jgi:hypothetical protein
MKNDDFWKSQFIKHDTVPSTGKLQITPAPSKPMVNPVSVETKEEHVPLVLSRFPAKTKTQWEQWLLNRKAVLVKK